MSDENFSRDDAVGSKKVDVNHIKIFGCKTTYIPKLTYIPKKSRKKLDPKLKECITCYMLGYYKDGTCYHYMILKPKE